MTEEQVFLAVLDLPDAAARAAYLDETCGEDAEFRRQVEALLAAHFRTGAFLDVPAAEQVHAGSKNDNTVAIEDAVVSAVKDHEDESDDLKFLSPSTRPDSLGRLGHYEILQVLGKGGFGIVFRAFDDMLQRVVAVKVMAPQLAATSPARRRFLREARSSAAVRHDNVVQVYEVGEQPLPYLVMEFVPGETLQQKLDRCGPLDVPEVLRIGRQVAEGLAAAHACDLIHRDIKPGNILLEGGSHKAKITDFGLARAADDASISQSGVIAGTPMFMAPEQALGHHIDQRADLFSLSSVLYQMASGRPPFRAPSTLAVLKRVAEDLPRPIPEIIPETPAWLCGIIAKLHAKNPADRFQSAREVADLLADCEAKLKAKQEVKNVVPAAVKPSRWKWVAAVALLLLPVIALAVTEFAGVTYLFRQQKTTPPWLAKQEPASPDTKSPKEKKDPDRRAAEYVLSIGGTVRVNGRDRDIKADSDLPLEAFQLTRVDLEGNKQVSNSELAHFKDCTNLTDLILKSTQVSDVGVAHFTGCKGLTHLDLRTTLVSDSGLAYFEGCKDLTHLSLDGKRVGDVGLAHFAGCKKLRHVSLFDTQVSDVSLALLASCENLSQIWLPVTQLSDAGLALFKKHDNLVGLDLKRTNVSDTGLTHLEDCKNLKWLNVQKTRVTAAKIEALTKALPGCRIDWDGGVSEPLPPTHKNSIGMEFVIVPKGKSWLGGGKDKLGDKEVVIPADFYLGKYEVTQEDWEKVMGENPSHFARTGAGSDAVKDISDADLKRFPVENVSWESCQLFVAKLNGLEKEPGWIYRLPKEVEWEYACRGGPMSDRRDSVFDFYFAKPANEISPDQGRFLEGSMSRTRKVGSYKPNRLGLYDMHGNLWEMCDDTEKDGGGAMQSVARGGSFRNPVNTVPAASRETLGSSRPDFARGFRLARVSSGAPSPEAKTPAP